MGGGKTMGGDDATAAASEPARQQLVQGSLLDLVFVLDATGSMGRYILSATQSISDIVLKIVQSERADVQFALVAYRDHPPQDTSYITRVFPFTKQTDQMAAYLKEISAAGGGDGPEAFTAALADVVALPFRPNATKVVVTICDAPPHGLNENGDGFPNGDPEGRDPIQLCHQLNGMGVTVFVVACEPTLSQTYKFAIDFYRAVCKITGGSLLPLTSAALLPAAIIGGAQEQINLERLVAEAKREAEEQRRAGVQESEIARNIHSKWSAAHVTTPHLRTTDMYRMSDVDVHNVTSIATSASLASARTQLQAHTGSRFSESGASAVASASSASGAGMARLAMAPPPPMSMRMSNAAPHRAMASLPPFAPVPAAAPAFGAPAFAAQSSSVAAPAPAAGAIEQKFSVESDVISLEQVERIMQKATSSSAI